MEVRARSYRLYCAVYGCMNSSVSKPNLTFFKLPTDSQRLTEWLRLIRRDDIAEKPKLLGYRICETHFNVQDILPTPKRKVLKKNAIPSQNLPYIPSASKEGSRNEDNQSEQNESTCSYTIHECHARASSSCCSDPTKRKINIETLECSKKLKLHETKNDEKDTFNEKCDKFLTKELALLAKAQINSKLHGKENRYDRQYLIFCLNFYSAGQKAYQFLQSALYLPTISTLYKHCFKLTTDINEKTMSILKMKAELMTDVEKNCSAMISAATLEPGLFYDIKEDKIIGFQEVDGWQSPGPAKNALVIMVRGIFVNWKQPVAYALLSEGKNYDEITQWVDKVLETLLEIGLNVRTFVSNQGSYLWNAAKQRSVSIETPYFIINERKIYYIFDVPHLIKDVRNNLMQYDFHFGNFVAKYEHIVQFYNQDVEKSCRLADKVTNSHIKPKVFEKMQVCFAAQLFSKSVATGISTYVENNDIEESGLETAKFISIMNDLFDSLNSSALQHDYEYKRAYAGHEFQNTSFTEMLGFFQHLKLINQKTGQDCTSNVRFIEGFQITIKSIMLLFEELHSEGYSSLFTRRLNQDAVENLFDQIRRKNGMARNPTCRQFKRAFKKIFLSNIIKHPEGGNFSNDLGELLVIETKETSHTDEESFSSVQITCSDYNRLGMPEKNSLFHICSCLLKRSSEKHNDCQAFTSYIKPYKEIHNFSADSRYSRYQGYIKLNAQKLLVIPGDDFVEYVEEMERIFRSSFKRKRADCKLSASIYEQIKEIPFCFPCSCFPKIYLLKLFIRMRIFYTLKFNNKAFHVGIPISPISSNKTKKKLN